MRSPRNAGRAELLSVRLPIPRFLSAGEVFAGVGAIGVLRTLPAARVAVLASRSLLRDPLAGPKLRDSVKAQDVRVIEAPLGEPALDKLASVITEIADFGPDWIVAAGGGSVIDAAKLSWSFYEHPDLDVEKASRPFALPKLRGRARFTAVPTTSGSGSEVSSAALFSGADGKSKLVFVSHEFIPDIVILDPGLTTGLPASIVAAAGLDALAHAVESYVSRFENPLVDLIAEQAMRTLMRELPRTVSEPGDLDTRLRVMSAAMMAGWVQNLKVPGVGHAIAHQLGAFGIDHGTATGLMLAPAMRFNARDETVRCKYDRLAASAGLADANALIDAIAGLRAELGAPNPLRTADMAGQEELAAAALEDMCARANPRDLDMQAIHEILEDTRCLA